MASPSPARPLYTSLREFSHDKTTHKTDIAYSPRTSAPAPPTHQQHYSLRHFNAEKREHSTPICPADKCSPAPGQSPGRGWSGSQREFERQKMRHAAGTPSPSPAKSPPPTDSLQTSARQFSVLRARHLTGINESPRRRCDTDTQPAPKAKSNLELREAKMTHRAVIGETPRRAAATEAASPPVGQTPQRAGYRSYHQFTTKKGKHQVGRADQGSSVTPERTPDAAPVSQKEYANKKGRHLLSPPPLSKEPPPSEAQAGSSGLHKSHTTMMHEKTKHKTGISNRFDGTQSPFRVLRNSRQELKQDIKLCKTDIQASTEATSTRRVTHHNGRSTHGQGDHKSAVDLHVALTQNA